MDGAWDSARSWASRRSVSGFSSRSTVVPAHSAPAGAIATMRPWAGAKTSEAVTDDDTFHHDMLRHGDQEERPQGLWRRPPRTPRRGPVPARRRVAWQA